MLQYVIALICWEKMEFLSLLESVVETFLDTHILLEKGFSTIYKIQITTIQPLPQVWQIKIFLLHLISGQTKE